MSDPAVLQWRDRRGGMGRSYQRVRDWLPAVVNG
jgi:hypothetical protein